MEASIKLRRDSAIDDKERPGIALSSAALSILSSMGSSCSHRRAFHMLISSRLASFFSLRSTLQLPLVDSVVVNLSLYPFFVSLFFLFWPPSFLIHPHCCCCYSILGSTVHFLIRETLGLWHQSICQSLFFVGRYQANPFFILFWDECSKLAQILCSRHIIFHHYC